MHAQMSASDGAGKWKKCFSLHGKILVYCNVVIIDAVRAREDTRNLA